MPTDGVLGAPPIELTEVSDVVSPEELLHPESLSGPRPRPTAPVEAGLWSAPRRPLTVGLVLTITLVAAEALAVSTAMPIVARDLGGLELYGLVFSAFLIGSLLGIVIVGGLIAGRGLVGPFLGGLALFALGLALGGLAPSMPVLIGARFIQGIGGGSIPPIAYVAIGRALPPALRPRMFATLSTAWILPGVFGPAIAGLVAQTVGWRWIFLGLLPLIVVSGSLALRGLRSLPPTAAARGGLTGQRVVNAVLVAIGVAVVTAGLASETPLLGVALALGGGALAAFAFVRLTPAGTLVARRGYPTAILLRGVLTFAFFCVDAYVALLLVEVRGWSAAEAGIALTAATVSWTAGSWIQARMSSRMSHERLAQIGFPIVAVGVAGLELVLVPAVPAWFAVPIFALAGLGMGLTYAQFALIVLRDAPMAIQGSVTAGLTLSDAVGTALGTGVSAAVVSTAVRSGAGPGPGIAVAIGVGALVAAFGFLLSPRLNPSVR